MFKSWMSELAGVTEVSSFTLVVIQQSRVHCVIGGSLSAYAAWCITHRVRPHHNTRTNGTAVYLLDYVIVKHWLCHRPN